MRFAELQPHNQFSEAALNSVTQRYIDSHIRHTLKNIHGYRELHKLLSFLLDLKKQWAQSGDPSTFEIADVLEPYRQNILDYLKGLLKEKLDNYFPIFQAAVLTNVGVHWPEIIELFDLHKEPIVKRMLEVMKNGHNSSDVDSWLKALRAIGVDWKELDIIERSRNAFKQISEHIVRITSTDEYIVDSIKSHQFYITFVHLIKYNDQLDIITHALDANKKYVLKYILDAIKNNYFMGAAKYLTGLKNAYIHWPELDKIKADIKTPCITRMLTTLKRAEYDRDHLTNILETIKYLNKAGIEWPELQIIKNTAQVEFDNYPEDDEEDDYVEPDDDDRFGMPDRYY